MTSINPLSSEQIQKLLSLSRRLKEQELRDESDQNQFTRDTTKYEGGKWTQSSTMSEIYLPELKKYQVDAVQTVVAITKGADRLRTAGRATANIFQDLEHVIENRGAEEDMRNTLEHIRRLAVYRLATAKGQATTSSPPSTPATLRLSVVYLVDPTTNRLRTCTNSELQVHPYLARHFLRMVRHNSILLSPFLVRPFIPACYAHLGPNPFKPDLTHGIDAAPFISALGLLAGASSSPMSISMEKFWVYPVSRACRNVWYRLLHRKIPHRSLLNRLIPYYFPFDTYSVCATGSDTLEYFLYDCPKKWLVWQTIWDEYFRLLPLTTNQLQKALFHLEFPPSICCPLPVSPAIVVGYTLLAVWRATWQLIFNNQPFAPSIVIQSARRLIRQAYREELFLQGCAHRALPLFSLN
ncbi:hypothetical protein G6F43_007464 [Rhizopus delemar]|nr:hypothetical protein G6F43_007464 [Rhizopus delemar]